MVQPQLVFVFRKGCSSHILALSYDDDMGIVRFSKVWEELQAEVAQLSEARH